MFQKILIANRGEIALRIIRACKEMGITTVAVYSEADRDSLHVRYADEDICIGPAPSKQSYLHTPSIISAAEITDVEAIHPGYGFLSENPHFAEVCESCRIKFIGTPPSIMKVMGEKTLAKKKMKEAGIPVIPGSQGTVRDKEEALKIARDIGYPVIIKAVAGGGGRGMQVAHNDVRLVNAFLVAESEAEAAFGDSRLYIEKYIERPRHIEFQILADEYGDIIHLGERDCTIQRKHQKLIEESPAPNLDEKLRRKMAESAIRGASAVDYIGVGTIEFLVDRQQNFYFVEMNTRLQVEHPVTEMVTSIDIVKEQIRIAFGEKLQYRQEDIQVRGFAIECRINAEDPENGFAPSSGKILTHNVPGGPGIRVDTHVYPEYTVSPYYDSLIAKLIAIGETRLETIARMKRALEEYVIEGVKTTVPLHRHIFNSRLFVNGSSLHTGFLDELLGQEKKEKRF